LLTYLYIFMQSSVVRYLFRNKQLKKNYFNVSYGEIIRFKRKFLLIGPLWGELLFFRIILRLRGMKKNSILLSLRLS